MDKITRDRGFHCASYKDKCLRRRVAVRMRARGCDSCEAYTSQLDTDTREYDRLMRSLTINVTRFFRNWDTYAVIQQRVVPELWGRREPIKVWSAGCSSGEEPYSAAILFHQQAAKSGEIDRLDSVSVVGTDIDNDCLHEANLAFYSEKALADTPTELRERYFPEVAGMHTIPNDVRRLATFEYRDMLLSPPPAPAVHLLMCRNVIIYFEREAQERLFEEFHRALAPGGFLVLGKVETLLGRARSMFTPVNARERVFRKI
jgi:chemotaxis protein methyltransferase CheR